MTSASIEVLADIAATIDLPSDALKDALDGGTYLDRVIAQERLARELGVTGVPAMFVGDDPATAEPVIGAVPYEWLQAAVERALSGESLDWRKRALQNLGDSAEENRAVDCSRELCARTAATLANCQTTSSIHPTPRQGPSPASQSAVHDELRSRARAADQERPDRERVRP